MSSPDGQVSGMAEPAGEWRVMWWRQGAASRRRVHSRGRLSWAVEPGLISGGPVTVCRFGSWLVIVDHLRCVPARVAVAVL